VIPFAHRLEIGAAFAVGRAHLEAKAAGWNPLKAIPARLPPLGPPKRLFEFVRDVAPGDADIVQVALGPACELLAIAITLPPEMKGLANAGPDSRGQAGPNLVEAEESLDISGDQAC
jgi:hypothetical protein